MNMSGNKTKVARAKKTLDFGEHNEEVKRLWKEFEAGKPSRIPVQWSMSYKMLVLSPSLNVWGYGFRDCFDDPNTMLRAELEFEHWRRQNVWCDWEMGLPKQWDVGVNFQNVYESCWLGAPVHFADGQVPDAEPFLKTREAMEAFVNKGIPDPFGGFMAKAKSFYEVFQERKKEGFTFKDAPLGNVWTPMGTDGPFTIAVNITAGEILKLLYRDPDFVEKFLRFMADALLERMKAWHRFMGVSFPYKGFGFADDGIQLLSPKTYARFVLPLHKRIVETFCVGRPGIHLCGAVAQHLETLRDELHIASLDTGFPLDLEKARQVLGEDVTIRGNLHVATLYGGPKEKVEKETLRIIRSGVTRGRKFIFGEGNNVAPNTPAENLNHAYFTVKRHGRYDD
jgi:uroporphyrinogen-III decarboxylase